MLWHRPILMASKIRRGLLFSRLALHLYLQEKICLAYGSAMSNKNSSVCIQWITAVLGSSLCDDCKKSNTQISLPVQQKYRMAWKQYQKFSLICIMNGHQQKHLIKLFIIFFFPKVEWLLNKKSMKHCLEYIKDINIQWSDWEAGML